jgi:methyl-accepting chemotaxis protein
MKLDNILKKVLVTLLTILFTIASIVWLFNSDIRNKELFIGLIGLFVSVIAYLISSISTSFVLKQSVTDKVSYTKKIQSLLKILKSSSEEIDKTFEEISFLSQEKEKKIEEIEKKLNQLVDKEKELTSKIQTLEKVPLEAINHFEASLEKKNRRSAYRDYILFFLGILFSIIISVILKKIGIG